MVSSHQENSRGPTWTSKVHVGVWYTSGSLVMSNPHVVTEAATSLVSTFCPRTNRPPIKLAGALPLPVRRVEKRSPSPSSELSPSSSFRSSRSHCSKMLTSLTPSPFRIRHLATMRCRNIFGLRTWGGLPFPGTSPVSIPGTCPKVLLGHTDTPRPSPRAANSAAVSRLTDTCLAELIQSRHTAGKYAKAGRRGGGSS